jgi:hypothetical protein
MSTENFTLDKLLKLPLLRKLEPEDFFLNQDFFERFRQDPAIKLDDSTNFRGLKVYLKPKQSAGCWRISDPEISRAYLNDEINEVELLYLGFSKNKNVAAIGI